MDCFEKYTIKSLVSTWSPAAVAILKKLCTTPDATVSDES